MLEALTYLWIAVTTIATAIGFIFIAGFVAILALIKLQGKDFDY